MGSRSDWNVMKACEEQLKAFAIPYEVRVVSAHRTPKRLYSYAQNAKAAGIQVIIAAAGGAAHLPGMVASLTPLPVLGVPIKTTALKGTDSLLSIMQMPAGVPVATLAVDGAKNAALLATAILALSDATLARTLEGYRRNQTNSVPEKPQ